MANGREWLRVRGMGRERLAGYLADYLESLGFAVERSDSADPAETRLTARLTRMNPAVPASGRELRFRFYPNSGGAAATWEFPTEVEPSDSARLDRLARELESHLERAILTESHATAKVVLAPGARRPWQPPTVS